MAAEFLLGDDFVTSVEFRSRSYLTEGEENQMIALIKTSATERKLNLGHSESIKNKLLSLTWEKNLTALAGIVPAFYTGFDGMQRVVNALPARDFSQAVGGSAEAGVGLVTLSMLTLWVMKENSRLNLIKRSWKEKMNHLVVNENPTDSNLLY